jgi:hypothetical protein
MKNKIALVLIIMLASFGSAAINVTFPENISETPTLYNTTVPLEWSVDPKVVNATLDFNSEGAGAVYVASEEL